MSAIIYDLVWSTDYNSLNSEDLSIMDKQVISIIKEQLPKMTEKEKLAFFLAFGAHTSTDQRDQAGLEYIGHPLTVYSHCDTEDERIVALLHDVLEDTKITRKDLELLFPTHIVEAVALLSHPKTGYDRDAYIRNIKANPLARKVKIEDFRANIDESRIQSLVEWHRHEVETKYKPNLDFLLRD